MYEGIELANQNDRKLGVFVDRKLKGIYYKSILFCCCYKSRNTSENVKKIVYNFAGVCGSFNCCPFLQNRRSCRKIEYTNRRNYVTRLCGIASSSEQLLQEQVYGDPRRLLGSGEPLIPLCTARGTSIKYPQQCAECINVCTSGAGCLLRSFGGAIRPIYYLLRPAVTGRVDSGAHPEVRGAAHLLLTSCSPPCNSYR